MNTPFSFPSRMEFTPIPNPFLNQVMPTIDDIVELKVSLHALAALYQKKGYPKYLTIAEIIESPGVITSLDAEGELAISKLRQTMEKASHRGVFINLVMQQDGKEVTIYLLNDDRGRMAAEQIASGKIILSGLQSRSVNLTPPEGTPNLFAVYEQNIGLLTPLISQEISAAEKIYPASWIEEAIKEAVRRNRRSWKYISHILENWATYGKSDATTETYYSKQDPDRYIRGHYGRIVRH